VTMKIAAMLEWGPEERTAKRKEWTQSLFTFRLQKATGQLENPMKIRELRRDLARLATLENMHVKPAPKSASVPDAAASAGVPVPAVVAKPAAKKPAPAKKSAAKAPAGKGKAAKASSPARKGAPKKSEKPGKSGKKVKAR
jgi:large subunit ribosomal protein L29